MEYLFYIFAGLAVLGALSLVLQRHPIYSALSLIVVMAALAVHYLMLGAEFMAAIQIIVYAGAIMVLFVLVIMLLNAGAEVPSERSWLARWLGAPLVAAFFIELALAFQNYFPSASRRVRAPSAGTPHEIGRLLFRDYVLPFEVTSLLILVAILGAIVLARPVRPETSPTAPRETGGPA